MTLADRVWISIRPEGIEILDHRKLLGDPAEALAVRGLDAQASRDDSDRSVRRAVVRGEGADYGVAAGGSRACQNVARSGAALPA